MASITSWTRLEPRARGNDMRPSLEARVHDPLWLLGRQWQVGEFQGEDAATPIAARLRGRADLVTAWRAGPDATAPALALDGALPLEALIEREEPAPDARLAAETGQHLLRMLRAARLDAYVEPLRAAHPLAPAPVDADPESLRYLAVMSGRVPDGDALAAAVRAAAGGIPAGLAVAPADADAVAACLTAWLDWYDGLVARPTPGEAAWQPSRLEHHAAVGARVAGADRTLTVAQFPGGALDWHAFDLGGQTLPGITAAGEDIVAVSLAAPASYPGMPARRWWRFEDSRVDFGGVEAAPEDLARILLAEFATVYGNDWYLLPVELPVGSLTAVSSLVVLDTFGEATLVQRVNDPGWSLFEISEAGAGPGDERHWNRLFLPPTTGVVIEDEPVENVLLARDERANVAWAVERVVESLTGGRIDRFVEWQARRAAEPTPAAQEPVGPGSPPAYRLTTDVPDHWIPLIPHELAPGRTELRRGAIRRPGPDGEVRVEPRGRLLPGQPLAFPEEEVPREGVNVTRGWRYTRTTDGSTCLWLGRRVQPGRGESSSGLQFDWLQDGSADSSG